MTNFILAQTCDVALFEEMHGELRTIMAIFKELRMMSDRRMPLMDFDIIISPQQSRINMWDFSFSAFLNGNRVVIYRVEGVCIGSGNLKFPYRYTLFKDIYDEQMEKDFMFYAKLMS